MAKVLKIPTGLSQKKSSGDHTPASESGSPQGSPRPNATDSARDATSDASSPRSCSVTSSTWKAGDPRPGSPPGLDSSNSESDGSASWGGFQFQQELKKHYDHDSQVSVDSKFGPHFIYILENAVICLILVDFVLLALSAEARSLGHDVNKSQAETYTGPLTSEECPLWLVLVHAGILFLFLLESIVRMWLVCRSSMKMSSHLLFDGCLFLLSCIFSGIFGFGSRWALLPRLFRVLRILHRGSLIKQPRFLKQILLLSEVMLRSVRMLICGIVLLLVNMIIFSVIAMDFLHTAINEEMKDAAAIERFGSQTADNCRTAFSSLVPTMGTLFALSIGDQWSEIAIPMIWARPDLLIFFMVYVFISSVVILGTVHAALHESFKEVRQNLFLSGDDERHKLKTEAMQRLASLFREIDTDNSGSISWQEFYHSRRSNEVFIRVLSDLEVNVNDLDSVWEVLDRNGDGELSREEFMDTMWQLQSGEHKWVTMQTSNKVNKIMTRLEQQQKQLEQGFSTLQSTLTEKINAISSSPSSKQSSKRKPSLQSNVPRVFSTRSVDKLHGNIIGNSNETDAKTTQNNLDIESALAKHTDDNKSEDESPDLEHHDSMPLIVDESEKDRLAVQRMCGVVAEAVANFARQDVVDFWRSAGSTSFIDPASDRVSKQCHRCDYFISHCWIPPADWHDVFGHATKETYGYKKALELNNTIRAIEQASNDKSVKEVRFGHQNSIGSSIGSKGSASATTMLWLDKCCIPQSDKKEMLLRIQLIESFIKLSDGLIVLLSWNYFTRLWCIYEWACFLWLHHPRDVKIGCDAFLKDGPWETLPLYIHSIESISVVRAQCSHEADHAILQEKVFRYYQGSAREESFASFERFAKCTAICFLAKQIMLWRTRNLEEETSWLGPLKDLAAKLGFTDLLVVLQEATPSEWWSQCNSDRLFRRIVQSWFEKVAVRCLLRERRRAVRTKWQIQDFDAKLERRGTEDLESAFEDSTHGTPLSSEPASPKAPGGGKDSGLRDRMTWSMEVNFSSQDCKAKEVNNVAAISVESSSFDPNSLASSPTNAVQEMGTPGRQTLQTDRTSCETFQSEREPFQSSVRRVSDENDTSTTTQFELRFMQAGAALRQQSIDAVVPEPPKTKSGIDAVSPEPPKTKLGIDAVVPEPPKTKLANYEAFTTACQNSATVEECAVAMEGLTLLEKPSSDLGNQFTIPAHLQIDELVIAHKPGVQKQKKTLAESAIMLSRQSSLRDNNSKTSTSVGSDASSNRHNCVTSQHSELASPGTSPKTLKSVLVSRLEEQHARTEEQALQLKQIMESHHIVPRSLNTDDHDSSAGTSPSPGKSPRTLRRVLVSKLEEQHARTEEQSLQLRQIIGSHPS